MTNCYTIYNETYDELIGYFKSATLLARYLYPTNYRTRSTNVIKSAQHGWRIKNSRFGCDLSIRFASKSEEEQLRFKDYITFNDYPKDVINVGGNKLSI